MYGQKRKWEEIIQILTRRLKNSHNVEVFKPK